MNKLVFDQFVKDLESQGIDYSAEGLLENDKYQIGSIYENVKAFLESSNLVPSSSFEGLSNFGIGIPKFNSEVSVNDIGSDAIIDLCKSSNIPANHLIVAAEAIGHCLVKYSGENILDNHFNNDSPSINKLSNEIADLSTICGSQTLASLSDAATGLEAFGKEIDKTIIDAKVALTVTIMKFHRSAIARFIPNRPETQNLILFDVDNLEVYDLQKSRDASSSVRKSNRIPFVDLYKDPSPANTETKPVHLLVVNDVVPAKLFAEDQPLVGKNINMFDYSLQAGVVGYSHVDYTDLISDGVQLKKLILHITDGVTDEYVEINTKNRGGARFVMANNTNDSADRICSADDYAILNNATIQNDGTASALLAGLSADAYININYTAHGKINLKTSDINVMASIETALKTQSGSAPIAGDTAIFVGLTFDINAYEPEAKFSEENIRKTTKALRIMTRTKGYEIPGATSVIAQYSLSQTKPETVINGISKFISIGNDDRGINILLDGANNVYDRLQNEKAYDDEDYTKKVMNDFVAGHMVKPYIYRDTFDINTNLQNMRSGEIWGDMKGLVEKTLLEAVTRIYQESYYCQALDGGEKPTWSVLTSGYILSSLLSLPQYVQQYANKPSEEVGNGIVEYRRVLPDNTVLNVITTTFDYMSDKIFMIPIRPGKQRDILNFAQNVDLGTFIAQITPYVEGSVSKQIVANAREFPIITNPVAIILTISGLSSIYNGVGSLGI